MCCYSCGSLWVIPGFRLHSMTQDLWVKRFQTAFVSISVCLCKCKRTRTVGRSRQKTLLNHTCVLKCVGSRSAAEVDPRYRETVLWQTGTRQGAGRWLGRMESRQIWNGQGWRPGISRTNSERHAWGTKGAFPWAHFYSGRVGTAQYGCVSKDTGYHVHVGGVTATRQA